jgi:hypothetical protein
MERRRGSADSRGEQEVVRHRKTLLVVILALSTVLPAAAQQGNILDSAKHCYSEIAGWLNWRPSGGGVTVGVSYLKGFAWGENIGWINLGNGPANSTQYTQSSSDFGVNRNSGTGQLSGYAWSDTCGWINFAPANSGQQTTVNASGVFAGYAWGEAVGWINLAPLRSTTPSGVESWKLFGEIEQ